jgi:pimeloyl-[acyl-carrier protein] methyl ester esterase
MDGTGELFIEFVRALPPNFRAEVISYPNNETRTYSQLIEAIPQDFEPYVLLAESFSTPLAIAYASTNPSNLKGLILCAGFAANPVPLSLRWIIHLSPLIFASTPPVFVIKWLLAGKDASASLVSAVQSSLSSVLSKVLADRIRSVAACDVRIELSRVVVPVLYIQAGMDRLIRPSCLDEIRRVKPEVTFSIIEAPHLVLQREPQQAVDIVTKFVEQLTESTGETQG